MQIELTCSGLNILTRENLEFGLSANSTVLVVWNPPNCKICSVNMWTVYMSIYAFINEKTVRFWLLCDFSTLSWRRLLEVTRAWSCSTALIPTRGTRSTDCL